MVEVTLAFFAGFLLNWYALAILCILGSVFESIGAHSLSVFVGLVAMVSAYFFFGIATSSLLLYVMAYFAIGLLWSFWRYKRYADKVVEMCKSISDNQRRLRIEELAPSTMVDKIATWVIIWPFSMVENVLGDVFVVVQTTVSKFFKGVYARIYESAIARVKYDSE